MKRLAGVLMGFLLVLAAPGCRLIVLQEAFTIETFPGRRNQILAEEERIYVRFDGPVDALSAEECLTVGSAAGNVKGLKSWEGGTLYFTPQPGLVYGRRYVLSVQGAMRSEEGRKVDVSVDVAFYYIAEGEPPPRITGFTPAEGAQVGVATPLRLMFSKPMETSLFREGFSLHPDRDYTLTWNPEETEATLAPEPEWTNNTVYEARVSTTLTDDLGIPLAAAMNRTFYAAEDPIPPEVSEVVPALRDWDASFPARMGAGLNDLEYRDVIRIVFSEEMDAERSAAALLLNPPLAAFKIWTDPSTLVLVPEAGFEMAREYSLLISDEAADRSGNHLPSPFSARFTSAIPELTLISLDSGAPAFPLTQFSGDQAVEIEVGAGPIYRCTFTFAFGGAGFPTDTEKLAAQQSITLRGLFPSDVLSPTVMGYGWVGESLLEITFAGFEGPAALTDTYYLLEIPGGPGGLRNATGSFLKADIRQLLKVKP